jgi:hypothetical protein
MPSRCMVGVAPREEDLTEVRRDDGVSRNDWYKGRCTTKDPDRLARPVADASVGDALDEPPRAALALEEALVPIPARRRFPGVSLPEASSARLAELDSCWAFEEVAASGGVGGVLHAPLFERRHRAT